MNLVSKILVTLIIAILLLMIRKYAMAPNNDNLLVIFPNLLNKERFENNVVSEEKPTASEEVVPEEESVVSEEVVPEEESVVSEEVVSEEEGKKTERDKKVAKVMDDYSVKNKECYTRILNNDKVYYGKFEKAFERFTKETFQKKLGYIPQKTDINKMDKKEYELYVHILTNLPSCDDLINKYTSKNEKVSTPVGKPKKITDILSKVGAPVEKTSNQTTTILSKVDGSIPTITTVIKTNRGIPDDNSHGDRRLNPKNAPYMQYIKNIGNQLQNITFKLDNLSTIKASKDTVDKEKYLRKEKKIIEKLQSDAKVTVATKMVENANDKLYVTANNTSNKLFNDKENKAKIGAKFNYKPLVKFDHKEPSKKHATTYGWSFMPPQYWSVPQKRPPVCIPQHNKQATVTPVFDKGTPVDAMSWIKPGSNLPKVEYTETYNANYYYPGWKTQNMANDPLKGKKFVAGEYYSNNLARKTTE